MFKHISEVKRFTTLIQRVNRMTGLEVKLVGGNKRVGRPRGSKNKK